MTMKKKVLFVDDEQAIRVTLPVILEREGFEVDVATAVPEALRKIQGERYDILLSDLNIGQPGDGFTVVSAMRRVQPDAATFILTGYPDFESALIAIRNQVDDYLVKPADIQKLVEALKEKSAQPRRPGRALATKRISTIILENQQEIIRRWLKRVNAHAELSSVSVVACARIDHLPELLEEIADRIVTQDETASDKVKDAAMRHGQLRREQGYTIPMLLVEAAILEATISSLLQEHLLAIDISTLVLDLNRMSETINHAVERSVRGYLAEMPTPKVA